MVIFCPTKGDLQRQKKRFLACSFCRCKKDGANSGPVNFLISEDENLRKGEIVAIIIKDVLSQDGFG